MPEQLRTCGRCGIADANVLDLDTDGAYHPEPKHCVELLKAARDRLKLGIEAALNEHDATRILLHRIEELKRDAAAVVAPAMEECRDCDGCGWHEGGAALKTTCANCSGTGSVARKTQLTDNGGAPPVTATEKRYTIEQRPFGKVWTLYDGRDDRHHGLNLCALSDFDANGQQTRRMIEDALNELAALRAALAPSRAVVEMAVAFVEAQREMGFGSNGMIPHWHALSDAVRAFAILSPEPVGRHG